MAEINPEVFELKIDSTHNSKGILEIYKQNNSETILLIIPGGGYKEVVERTGKPISNRFQSYGYNTAILKYSVYPFSHPVQLEEGLKSLEILSQSYNNIIVIGFSAGGHLAGLLGTNEKKYNLKAMVLCYPVISLDEYCHEESAKNYLGDLDNKENRIKFSIHKRVNSNCIPCYIWAVKTDELVPYENTQMMIEELKNKGIKYKYDIFENGVHAMALADESTAIGNNPIYINKEVATWVDHCNEFIKDIISIQ